MKRPLFKGVFPQALALVAAISVCGAMALAQDAAPANGQRTDGQIEMDVVHALDASQALKSDLITAATIQGEVTLSGTVTSDASRKLAESIVKGVPGVSGVHDNLKVGNPADDPNAQGAVDDNSGQDSGDENQSQPANPPTMSPSPDNNGQASGYPQNQPGYPQDQPQNQPNYPQSQPQYPQPGYGQQGPPPDYGQQAPQPGYGQQGPPPGYGQQAPPPGYGQAPPPGYGQEPPQGYGQNQYPGQYGQPYPQNSPRQPSYAPAKGPVTIPMGTLLQLRTSEPVSSKKATEGTPVQFTVIRDVVVGNVLAIPRGATVHGVITDVHHSGQLAGSPELALRLTTLDLGGQDYPLQSDLFKVKGPSKTGRTVGNVVGGALLGALIGGAAGGGGGAAIGAAAGGTVGTAASAATPGPNAWIPAEALVSFHLAQPVTVNPVSPQEAARLAEGLYQGGPNLYRRGYYARPYYGGYGPYPYPPVYYRPYFMTGGMYYWR